MALTVLLLRGCGRGTAGPATASLCTVFDSFLVLTEITLELKIPPKNELSILLI